MRIRWKPLHICANDRYDGLGAGIANACHIPDRFCRLLFFRLHEVVDLVIQIPDMDVELIQMAEQLFHHAVLEWGHDTIEVVNDLLFCRFEIMGDDVLRVHLIIPGAVKRLVGKDKPKNIARILAVNVSNSTRQLDISAFQHLLDTVEFPCAFPTRLLR